jgi:hypothetical protein
MGVCEASVYYTQSRGEFRLKLPKTHFRLIGIKAIVDDRLLIYPGCVGLVKSDFRFRVKSREEILRTAIEECTVELKPFDAEAFKHSKSTM